jgi:predicted dehydrogenase
MTLRVGIVSANWGALAHLPAWRALPGVEVTAICTAHRHTAEAAAERYKVERPFWDAQAMCADPDLDIIDCGTRPVLRHAMVLAAFRHGKHVYNGIPFAATLGDARDMRDAWAASGRVGVVDALSQWLPQLRQMRAMLDEHYLGTPFGGSLRFNLCLYNPPMPGFPWNWFSEGGQGVSAVRNLGSHALHMLHYLFGEVDELVADDRMLLSQWELPDGQTLRAENTDFANALLRLKNGMVFQLQIGWNSTVPEGLVLEAFGSGGRFVATSPTFPTSQDCVLRAARRGEHLAEVAMPDRFKAEEGIGIDWTCPVPPAFPMALAMRSMVDAIEGKGQAAPDFEQAWQVERVQEAIRLSNAERRWVRVEEVG